MLNRLVAEIGLDGAGIDAVVRQLEPTAMAPDTYARAELLVGGFQLIAFFNLRRRPGRRPRGNLIIIPDQARLRRKSTNKQARVVELFPGARSFYNEKPQPDVWVAPTLLELT